MKFFPLSFLYVPPNFLLFPTKITLYHALQIHKRLQVETWKIHYFKSSYPTSWPLGWLWWTLQDQQQGIKSGIIWRKKFQIFFLNGVSISTCRWMLQGRCPRSPQWTWSRSCSTHTQSSSGSACFQTEVGLRNSQSREWSPPLSTRWRWTWQQAGEVWKLKIFSSRFWRLICHSLSIPDWSGCLQNI